MIHAVPLHSEACLSHAEGMLSFSLVEAPRVDMILLSCYSMQSVEWESSNVWFSTLLRETLRNND